MMNATLAGNSVQPRDCGELEQIGRRIENLVAKAQANSAQLEVITDRVIGSAPRPVSAKGDGSMPSSLIGKLHELCGYLDANLESIGDSVERLSRL